MKPYGRNCRNMTKLKFKTKIKIMNKLKSIFLAGATVFSSLAIAQPISDVAVIPVAITINTTMRLNVVSGGNVEFVVNTISQYENGISNPNQGSTDPIHDTRFTVASSRDFDVFMFAEDANFIGTDVSSAGTVNTLDLGNVGYRLHEDGTHDDATHFDLIPESGDPVATLTNATTTQVVSHIDAGPGSAGGTDDNDFTINWELATADVVALNGLGTLLSQSIAQDRYITNVYLVLQPAD